MVEVDGIDVVNAGDVVVSIPNVVVDTVVVDETLVVKTASVVVVSSGGVVVASLVVDTQESYVFSILN